MKLLRYQRNDFLAFGMGAMLVVVVLILAGLGL